MKISICIVNHDTGKLLEECLDSVARFSPRGDYEIIVVDNHSSDGLPEKAAAREKVRLIRNEENAGFARGNNQAFQAATGDYFLLLNPDTEVREGAIDALVDCADAHPGAGMVAARLLNADGTTQVGFNIRRLPGFRVAFNQLWMVDELWPGNRATRRYFGRDLDYDRLQEVEQPAASALLYRRTAWAKVGGFDVRFANWFNDVDLCKRVREGGWEILYCPSARILHHGGMGSASRTIASVVTEMYRSQRLYYLKHFGPRGYWLVSGLVVTGMLMRWAGLTMMPGRAGSLRTHARQDRPDALRSAFKEVLRDTVKTWRSLPVQFRSAASE